MLGVYIGNSSRVRETRWIIREKEMARRTRIRVEEGVCVRNFSDPFDRLVSGRVSLVFFFFFFYGVKGIFLIAARCCFAFWMYIVDYCIGDVILYF